MIQSGKCKPTMYNMSRMLFPNSVNLPNALRKALDGKWTFYRADIVNDTPTRKEKLEFFIEWLVNGASAANNITIDAAIPMAGDGGQPHVAPDVQPPVALDAGIDMQALTAVIEARMTDALRAVEERTAQTLANEMAEAKRRSDAERAEAEHKHKAETAEIERRNKAEKDEAERRNKAEKAEAERMRKEELRQLSEANAQLTAKVIELAASVGKIDIKKSGDENPNSAKDPAPPPSVDSMAPVPPADPVAPLQDPVLPVDPPQDPTPADKKGKPVRRAVKSKVEEEETAVIPAARRKRTRNEDTSVLNLIGGAFFGDDYPGVKEMFGFKRTSYGRE